MLFRLLKQTINSIKIIQERIRAQPPRLAEHVEREGQQAERPGRSINLCHLRIKQGRNITIEPQSEIKFFSDRKRWSDFSLPVAPALTSTGLKDGQGFPGDEWLDPAFESSQISIVHDIEYVFLFWETLVGPV